MAGDLASGEQGGGGVLLRHRHHLAVELARIAQFLFRLHLQDDVLDRSDGGQGDAVVGFQVLERPDPGAGTVQEERHLVERADGLPIESLVDGQREGREPSGPDVDLAGDHGVADHRARGELPPLDAHARSALLDELHLAHDGERQVGQPGLLHVGVVGLRKTPNVNHRHVG